MSLFCRYMRALERESYVGAILCDVVEAEQAHHPRELEAALASVLVGIRTTIAALV